MAGKAEMPEFRKAPQALVDAFSAAIAGLPDTEMRKMFGYPAAFTAGQMAGGLFQDRVMVRLSAEDRARALALPDAAPFEPMSGRPMREYVVLPREVAADPSGLREWLARAAQYTRSLPPRKPKSGGGRQRD